MFMATNLWSIILILAMFFGWFSLLGHATRLVPTLTIIVPFLQILAVVGRYGVEWGRLGPMFAIFSVFNLNFELTLLGCMNPRPSYSPRSMQKWVLVFACAHARARARLYVCHAYRNPAGAPKVSLKRFSRDIDPLAGMR